MHGHWCGCGWRGCWGRWHHVLRAADARLRGSWRWGNLRWLGAAALRIGLRTGHPRRATLNGFATESARNLILRGLDLTTGSLLTWYNACAAILALLYLCLPLALHLTLTLALHLWCVNRRYIIATPRPC